MKFSNAIGMIMGFAVSLLSCPTAVRADAQSCYALQKSVMYLLPNQYQPPHYDVVLQVLDSDCLRHSLGESWSQWSRSNWMRMAFDVSVETGRTDRLEDLLTEYCSIMGNLKASSFLRSTIASPPFQSQSYDSCIAAKAQLFTRLGAEVASFAKVSASNQRPNYFLNPYLRGKDGKAFLVLLELEGKTRELALVRRFDAEIGVFLTAKSVEISTKCPGWSRPTPSQAELLQSIACSKEEQKASSQLYEKAKDAAHRLGYEGYDEFFDATIEFHRKQGN